MLLCKRVISYQLYLQLIVTSPWIRNWELTFKGPSYIFLSVISTNFVYVMVQIRGGLMNMFALNSKTILVLGWAELGLLTLGEWSRACQYKYFIKELITMLMSYWWEF